MVPRWGRSWGGGGPEVVKIRKVGEVPRWEGESMNSTKKGKDLHELKKLNVPRRTRRRRRFQPILWPCCCAAGKKMKNQSINTKVTFKICSSLCLTFDCKGHLRNHQMWSISYLTCKVWTKSVHKQQDTFYGHCSIPSISYLRAKGPTGPSLLAPRKRYI